MKHTITIWITATFLFITSPGYAQFAGGSGTEEDPYQVATIEQLQQISYQKGEGDYTAFRSPAMVVTKEGTILAFAEGRFASWHDDGAEDDIVAKRSTDGGQTWGPLIVATEYGEDTAKNAVPIVLPSGRILLVYNYYEYVLRKEDRDGAEVHMVYSDDDGVTWSDPRDITPMVYEDDWIWNGTGPGHGIVKEREPHKGRIIVAGRHNPGKGISGSSYIMYSDDDGETWDIGAFALRDQTNESMAVELSNGDIMVNSRSGRSKEEPYRGVSISSDGGGTFDTFYVDSTLIEPQGCQGSILKHSFNEETGKYNLLFSNPHHTVERVRGAIKLSPDDGKTWTKLHMYSDPYPRFSGYSDIGVLNEEGDIGVLWETGSHYAKGLRYDGVVFNTVQFSNIDVPIDEVEQTYYGDSTPNPHPTKDYVWVFDTRPKHYIQVADIDASETENWNDGQGFDPIGNDDNPLRGSYDGNGYTIKNLTIDRPDKKIGLFGWPGGEIRNVVLVNVSITGGDLTGGLVGRLRRGRIVNSHVSGRISGGNPTGGMVGDNQGGRLIESFSTTDVTGSRNVGGLVGEMREGGIIRASYSTDNNVSSTKHDAGGLVGAVKGGEVYDSFSTSFVSAAEKRAGGLAGHSEGETSVISNCFATGMVSTTDVYAGGLLGRNRDGSKVFTSYSTGAVYGGDEATAAGFIGGNFDGGEITTSYWDTETSGFSDGVKEGEADGVAGLTTAEMTGAAAADNMTGLDFVELWQATEGYPMLFWQDGDEVTSGGEPGAGDELPGKFRLLQNYPNPFNPVTKIGFELPVAAEVRLEVYDVLGRRVAVLASGEYQSGSYEVSFDAGVLSSGIYLYRLAADGFTETRRMLLVK